MDNIWIQITDMICTLIFIVEMGIKHVALGVKNYWKSRWNRLDGTLVILSIPSIIAFLFPISMMDLSFLMILRLLRSLRFSQSTAFLSQYRTGYQRFQAGDQRILCHTALLSAVNRLVRPHQLQSVQRYGTNVLRDST